jgi:hypothetical protein
MTAPLFTEYLMHFCAQRKTPRQAQAVLESILRRGRFIPSRCPLFADPDGELEREGLQAWASMVCFTDLRFQDLHFHMKKFGMYGIAIKKDSALARRCEPVQYVEVGSTAQRNSRRMSEGIRQLCEMQRQGRIDRNWDVPRVLKELDARRVASMQDIKTRNENEWRFIGLRREDVLEFEPRDVRFLLVETWTQANRWNQRLNDAREQSLYPYGRAGVMAIPVELLIGTAPERVPARKAVTKAGGNGAAKYG